MFGAILTATNSSFQKGLTFCPSTYVKKVMKLLAFIFEQPSYTQILNRNVEVFCVRAQKFFIVTLDNKVFQRWIICAYTQIF